jgi:hypothetical protein
LRRASEDSTGQPLRRESAAASVDLPLAGGPTWSAATTTPPSSRSRPATSSRGWAPATSSMPSASSVGATAWRAAEPKSPGGGAEESERLLLGSHDPHSRGRFVLAQLVRRQQRELVERQRPARR